MGVTTSIPSLKQSIHISKSIQQPAKHTPQSAHKSPQTYLQHLAKTSQYNPPNNNLCRGVAGTCQTVYEHVGPCEDTYKRVGIYNNTNETYTSLQ